MKIHLTEIDEPITILSAGDTDADFARRQVQELIAKDVCPFHAEPVHLGDFLSSIIATVSSI